MAGNIVAFALTLALFALPSAAGAQQTSDGVRINQQAIGGVVTGAQGPEAGAWVIAETTGLPTKFAKIVVTDERGRYVIPELPAANRAIKPQLGEFASSVEAWEARIQSGQAATNMVNDIGRLDTQRALKLFADWTDRIAAGAVPPAAPQRPQGIERNLVVTLWDWSDGKAYLHDSISTDRRDPTVNAGGLLYGATEESTQDLPVLDPVKNVATTIHIPVRDPETPSAANLQVLHASPYWGEDKIWDSQASVHNPMLDKEGRVWFTARIRGEDNPAFCKKGSEHPSAKAFPVEKSTRQLAMYDPKTQKFTLIDTCFTTHHLQFAFDDDNTLWTSAGGPQNQVAGWLNTKKFLATGDAAASPGWTPLVLDTNGNGKRDDYVEPNQPVDPQKDKRIVAGLYGIRSIRRMARSGDRPSAF